MVFIIIERIYNRFRVNSVNFGETFIKDVNLFSSKVKFWRNILSFSKNYSINHNSQGNAFGYNTTQEL